MKKIFFGIIVLNAFSSFGQWNYNGLNDGNLGNTFGTFTANPINIYTNSINTAQFSTGNSLSSPWDFNLPNNPIGDGLRIMPQTGAFGYLDMFTGNQNTTHIKWGNSGSISGQNSRFEQHANGQGFFFNSSNSCFSSIYFKS